MSGPLRTNLQRLPSAARCDVCRTRNSVSFRIDFDDGTYSERCARHVGVMFDVAGARHTAA